MPCHILNQNGFTAIACTRGHRTKPQRCSYCNRPAPLLCDYPDPSHASGTCDKPICPHCSTRVASNTDYCKAHGADNVVKK